MEFQRAFFFFLLKVYIIIKQKLLSQKILFKAHGFSLALSLSLSNSHLSLFLMLYRYLTLFLLPFLDTTKFTPLPFQEGRDDEYKSCQMTLSSLANKTSMTEMVNRRQNRILCLFNDILQTHCPNCLRPFLMSFFPF